MSVTTRVDILRENLKEHLKKAIVDLNDILDEDTWGNSDMSDAWLGEMEHIQAQLRTIRRKI